MKSQVSSAERVVKLNITLMFSLKLMSYKNNQIAIVFECWLSMDKKGGVAVMKECAKFFK